MRTVVEFITSACEYLHTTIISSADATASYFDKLIGYSQNTNSPNYHELNNDDELPQPLPTKLSETINQYKNDPPDPHEPNKPDEPCNRESMLSSTAIACEHFYEEGLPPPKIFSGRIEDLYGTTGKINALINFYPPSSNPSTGFSKPLLSDYN